MPTFLVPPIIPARVSPQKPFHARHKVRIGRLDNQMKVIAHQTDRMDLPIGFVAHLAQRIPEALPILVILKNGIASVSTIHHMIDRPRIFNSDFARHEGRTLRELSCVSNTKN